MRVEFLLGPETINSFDLNQKADLVALAVQAKTEGNYLDFNTETMTIEQTETISNETTCPTYVLNLILGD